MGTLTISKAIAVAAIVTSSFFVTQPQRAHAATFTESGDAGQTIPTAQSLGAGIDIIQGTIGSTNDADLFSFVWNGGAFTINTGLHPDPILSLYDSTGNLLAQNDDTNSLQSRISLANLIQGQYFVGIASFANFATSGPVFGGGGQYTGNYSITFNAPVAAAVPTPALLPGLVGLGMTAMRKRKQKATKAVV